MAIALLVATSSEVLAKSKKRSKRGKQKASIEEPAAAHPEGQAQAGTGAAPSAGPPVIDAELVLAHAKMLSATIGQRPRDSEPSAQAAAYIVAQLEALGLEVQTLDVGKQVVPAIDLEPFFSRAEASYEVSDKNLVVRFAPKSYAKDSPLLLMAHYDSVPMSPGAVDNAASVGLLLELARVLHMDAPSRRVVIAFTAAEEIGLVGATALAESLGDDLGLVVSLDLIGAPGHLTLNGLSHLMGRGWLMWFAEVSKQAKIDLRAPWTNRVVSQLFPELERSDHGPFTMRGIPAVHLYDRDDEVFLAYHTVHDTMSAIDKSSVEEAGKFIEMMTRTNYTFPKSGDGQGLWVPLPGGPKVASSLAAQAMELMFLFFAIMSIARLHRDAKDARAARPRGQSVDTRGPGLVVFLIGYLAIWLLVAMVLGVAADGSHSQPWVHSPSRYLAAEILLASALAYLALVPLARLGSWQGDARYLVVAISWCSLLGFLTLSFGVFELAWIFLLPAALLGGMARVGSRGKALLLLGLACLPLWGPLSSHFLREASFHGFLSGALPLPVLLGFLLFPYALALAFVLCRWPVTRGKKGPSVLVICGVLALVAVAMIASDDPKCSGGEFKLRGLACELEK